MKTTTTRCGHFFCFFLVFLVRKIPVCRDRTHVPTSQGLRGTSQLLGRPARCNSYVQSNSVIDADDDTTSAVSATRGGAHEKTYWCVCVCVFFPFILDFNRRTSRGHTEQGNTKFSIHISAVLALIFLARRIQPFLSLVDREVVRNTERPTKHPMKCGCFGSAA